MDAKERPQSMAFRIDSDQIIKFRRDPDQELAELAAGHLVDQRLGRRLSP